MFENYVEMNAEEKAFVRSVHKRWKKGGRSRYDNLAWGFIRGLPYKRIERSVYVQAGQPQNNNKPSANLLTYYVQRVLARTEEEVKQLQLSRVKATPEIEAWLANPDGAIPAPPPRPRKPFIREVAE